MIYLLRNLLKSIEYLVVITLGRLLGISYIVKYLRNPNPELTVKILIKFGATVGDRTTFKRGLIIDNSYEDQNSSGNFCHVKIGSNCYIGDCVYFDLSNEIVIGDNVVISGMASFVTHADCNRSSYLSNHFKRHCDPIFIRNGSWIGFRATIFPGVTVSDNSVVASCALLKEDTVENSVYGGMPAKLIRLLEQEK